LISLSLSPNLGLGLNCAENPPGTIVFNILIRLVKNEVSCFSPISSPLKGRRGDQIFENITIFLAEYSWFRGDAVH